MIIIIKEPRGIMLVVIWWFPSIGDPKKIPQIYI